MNWQWYNNRYKNIKIYEGDSIPEGYIKGYVILKDKRVRLKKLNDLYEKKIEDVLDHYKKLAAIKVKKLENELIEKQKKITNF